MTGKNAYPPNQFRKLINTWLQGDMDTLQFEQEYMDLWRRCRDRDGFRELNDHTCDCLDKVFTALDAYCDDPDTICDFEIDEAQLRKEVAAIAAEFAPEESS